MNVEKIRGKGVLGENTPLFVEHIC